MKQLLIGLTFISLTATIVFAILNAINKDEIEKLNREIIDLHKNNKRLETINLLRRIDPSERHGAV